MTGFYTTEQAAELLHCSPRTVRSLIAKDAIPYRRLPGMRRVLIPAGELELRIDGAELETVELDRGGRVVRTVKP